MSEIRYDLIHDEYILIAPERLHRPLPQPKMEVKEHTCPFCPGNEALTPPPIYTLQKDGKWQVRVVPNLYKALQIETPFESHREGINERWGGFGAHEIVIDTPRHLYRLDAMSQEELFSLLQALQARVADLKKDRRIIQLEIFKNHGFAAGASQSHPHTQIIGMPLMSKAKKHAFMHAHTYWRHHGRSLFADIVEQERSQERILQESDGLFAYCPFASSFPFEVIILAKNRHTIANMEKEELFALGGMLKNLIDALYKELGDFGCNLLFYLPPLNENFENAPFFEDIASFYRFFIRITPRIYHIAGFELLSGSAINPVAPELAAKLLRKHL